MKKLVAYFLIVSPVFAFGQLFPKVPDFRGNLRLVKEKKYGKEVSETKKTDGKYRPHTFSGWTFTYTFDKDSRLVRRTETFNNRIESIKKYNYRVDGSREITRQTETSNASNEKGNFLETEKIIGSNGQIAQVNYLSFDAKSGESSLYMVEDDAQYSGGKLTAFDRAQLDDNGDTTDVESCKLIYDQSGRMTGIRRTDKSSGFSTVISFHYNRRGWVDHYSVDLLAELQEIGKKQIQDIYYRYDRNGNWKKMYRGDGRKKQLQAKRKNKYW